MGQLAQPRFTKRYKIVTDEKAGGATYTPRILADFVARQVINAARPNILKGIVRILDPAIGDGELLLSILEQFGSDRVEVHGFETDPSALERARARISERFPTVSMHFQEGNFLEFVLEHFEEFGAPSLFAKSVPDRFDLIIANPPYVRTQIMGARQAQMLAHHFGLTGRVDLYYAFSYGNGSCAQARRRRGYHRFKPVYDHEIGSSGSTGHPKGLQSPACLGFRRYEDI